MILEEKCFYSGMAGAAHDFMVFFFSVSSGMGTARVEGWSMKWVLQRTRQL